MGKSNLLSGLFSTISGFWGGPVSASPSQTTVISNGLTVTNTAVNAAAQSAANSYIRIGNAYNAHISGNYTITQSGFPGSVQMSGTLSNQQLNQNNHGFFNNSYFQGQREESDKRCLILREELNKFDPIINTILNDIETDLNTSPNFTFILAQNPEEQTLTKKLKVGKIIAEHIRKRDFANKMEGIINDD